MIHIASIDNFLKDPFKARRFALSHDFSKPVQFQGHTYPGVVPLSDPELLAEIEAGLTKVHGTTAKVSLSFFRLASFGEETPAWIHSDNSCDKYAAVIHLTRPQFCAGGTAFWKHRKHGWSEMPKEWELPHHGVVFDQPFIDGLNRDAQTTDAWDMVGLMPMAYNRCLTYPSSLFHSRWPKESFGTDKDDGRLIIGCFYDTPSWPE